MTTTTTKKEETTAAAVAALSSSTTKQTTHTNVKMMKAVLASAFGEPDTVLSVGQAPQPTTADKQKLLIRVHACSLSPSDYRGLMGDKKVVACPSEWPYIPGGDVSGVVVAPQDNNDNDDKTTTTPLPGGFKVGDRVVSTWDIFGMGGLAQYALVDPDRTVHLPSDLDWVEGAALANSASHALHVCQLAQIQKGDRVLVLGGSGGVGTVLIPLLRQAGASHIAATSTDSDLLTQRLGVDRAIPYQDENWWEIPEYTQHNGQDGRLDVIIDCAVGIEAWNKASSSGNKKNTVLKGCREGGRFVAVVHNKWHIDAIDHYYQIVPLLLPPLGRQLYNMVRTTTPYYRMYLGQANGKSLATVLDMASQQEQFKAIVDSQSPYPFTTEGVRKAFNQHMARKGHGKIVIAVDQD